MTFRVAILAALVLLSGCQKSYEQQQADIDKFAKSNRIGQSGDAWLIKHSLYGMERVSLFFGYYDDWDACTEFATMYMQRYPADTYHCEFAN